MKALSYLIHGLFVIIVITAGPVLTAFAVDRVVSLGVATTNETKDTKTDFHLELTGTSPIKSVSNFAKINDNAPLEDTGVVNGSNSKSLTIDWKELKIPPGTGVSFNFIGKQDENNMATIGKSNFTPASPTDVPMLGFQVDAFGDVILTNAQPSAISFTDLLFQFPSEITSDSVLALLEGPPVGTPGLVSSGTVPSGTPESPGELLVGEFPLRPGDFLTGRFDAAFVDVGFSSLTAVDVIGHEHQTIPEPSTVLLCCTGLAGICVLRKRRLLRRAQATEARRRLVGFSIG